MAKRNPSQVMSIQMDGIIPWKYIVNAQSNNTHKKCKDINLSLLLHCKYSNIHHLLVEIKMSRNFSRFVFYGSVSLVQIS